jgi:hypothetical protein
MTGVIAVTRAYVRSTVLTSGFDIGGVVDIRGVFNNKSPVDLKEKLDIKGISAVNGILAIRGLQSWQLFFTIQELVKHA